MADDFDYTEINKQVAWHKELARDLFVALVGKEGLDCWPDTQVLTYLAVEMATDFEDGYEQHLQRDDPRNTDWHRRLDEYLTKRFGKC